MKKLFSLLSPFEWGLWSSSLAAVVLSFLLSPERDALSLAASAVGVTALIFVAKGHVAGQALTVVFAVLYGIVSFACRYYGEILTLKSLHILFKLKQKQLSLSLLVTESQ